MYKIILWSDCGPNTDLNRPENADIDDENFGSYKKQVVYGTVGNFAADILRHEFEYDLLRSDRRFDVVIVDEVDMLMLDEGALPFPQCSHFATH